mmetsp:Transcript_11526/g.20997  ORF Transcript_11526/g.20997 Transcript_11526/m.20997 type:complete len:448 (-) Transcript_11526:252-1595(-)|eukprot:CAMPEP_0198302652 /NCGR_PEP_ID=MMETSP1449-20131203/56014_1 /TAXON_ID=420275 /ORGANISM="Attheya septentrionalis, Strain CCMP2084" /LENGTH=447 /DNA_ID=CAMNT_0044005073 /DNA_START=154 /DNA_END=1497 /DNA_ORIENTATION=-
MNLKPALSHKALTILVVSLVLGLISVIAAVVVIGIGGSFGGGDSNQVAEQGASQGGAFASTPTPTTSFRPTLPPIPTLPPVAKPSNLAPSLLPTAKPTAGVTAAPMALVFEEFNFLLMGDVPYTPNDALVLPVQMREIQQMLNDQLQDPDLSQSLFIMHVGDIQMGFRTDCVESRFISMLSIIEYYSPIPFLLIQGDNDWNDCPKPDEAKVFFDTSFIGHETFWLDRPFPLQNGTTIPGFSLPSSFRRQAGVQENFAMDHEGILFVCVNLIELDSMSQTEFDTVIASDVQWVADAIDSFFQTYGYTPRAMILLGHPLRRPNIRPFFDALQPIFYEEAWLVKGDVREGMDFPVVYMHGDGHNYDVDIRMQEYTELNWADFFDIQCDKGGNAPPMMIEFRGSNKPPLTQERSDQYVISDRNGEGIIRFDRRGGLYDNPRSPDSRYPWPN